MKLFTNEDNIFSLKIIACSLLGRKQLELEFVSNDDKRFQAPRRLPVLELDSGKGIFSSNTACFYLYPPSPELEKEVNEWLEWDTFKFQPLLLTDAKLESSAKIEILLQELDKVLCNKTFLVKEVLTVADIALAASVYPLFTDDKLRASLFNVLTGLTAWISQILSMDEMTEGTRRAKLTSRGIKAVQGASAACWYPALKADLPSSAINDCCAKAVSAWQRGVGSRVKLKPPIKPVLPLRNEKNILITSALPYVNNVPHLGNIIGCVLSADVFARYCRSRNYNALYISGTDEYGTATETKALEEKMTPKEICDKYHAIHSEVYDWFNIKFDYFGRTTTQAQTEVVQHLFTKCHSNGFTLVDTVDQLLCEKCDRYLADRFVEGICPDCKSEDARGDQCDACGHLINAIDLLSPKCKVCGTAPVVKQSQQLFLDLPMLEEQLSQWFEKSSEGWSNIARVITKAWLKEGLKPRCITRDLKWGVPVPLKNFENKVFYVWFDAPIGYMSMSKLYTDHWLKWWQPDSGVNVKLYQFMAKDNVPFHSIMFPATLMASKEGYTILNNLYATEYLNYENGKFSKSRGIGVFGNDAKDTGIPSDIFRFYLLYMRPESQDSNFSWADLALKNNTELLNNLGNFILRSLTFVEKFYGGVVPDVKLGEDEKQLLAYCDVEVNGYITALEKGRLREGIKYILNISRHGNHYMQSLKPWDLLKGSDSDKDRAATAIGMLSNVVCLLASLLSPYMPDTVESIAHQVNLPQECFTIMDAFVPFLKSGHKINKPAPLFKKIESSTVEALKQKYAGRQKSESPEKTIPPPAASSNKNNGPMDFDLTPAIASLESAVQKQQKLVNGMTAAGASNQELDPHITTLATLTQKLTELRAPLPTTGEASAILEAAIGRQGELVRALKTAGVTKDELKPHLDKLLTLKSRLNSGTSQSAASQSVGKDSAATASKKKSKKNK